MYMTYSNRLIWPQQWHTQTRCADGLLLLHIYSADYLYAPAVVNCEVGSTHERTRTRVHTRVCTRVHARAHTSSATPRHRRYCVRTCGHVTCTYTCTRNGVLARGACYPALVVVTVVWPLSSLLVCRRSLRPAQLCPPSPKNLSKDSVPSRTERQLLYAGSSRLRSAPGRPTAAWSPPSASTGHRRRCWP